MKTGNRVALLFSADSIGLLVVFELCYVKKGNYMALSVSTQMPEQELEVELASPGARIGAYALNQVINFIWGASITFAWIFGFKFIDIIERSIAVLATIAVFLG
ncbi:hypothetical protein [Stenoxybacter acetivorans]|uniref:hypothetical protein n=1 Tax=Stenoxybacter acetivorans TaxID=422441 RepID=UPI00056CEF99|nr:hypothetical protein [Stenoxybacter acetivorans]